MRAIFGPTELPCEWVIVCCLVDADPATSQRTHLAYCFQHDVVESLRLVMHATGRIYRMKDLLPDCTGELDFQTEVTRLSIFLFDFFPVYWWHVYTGMVAVAQWCRFLQIYFRTLWNVCVDVIEAGTDRKFPLVSTCQVC